MIVNLTQHTATPDQISAGVIDPDENTRVELQELLTFTDVPTMGEIKDRARELGNLAAGLATGPIDGGTGVVEGTRIMIGGAPYLMAPLERELHGWGLVPVYAFSIRQSVETTAPDGTVIKRNIFKHAGWVEA